MGEKLLLRTSGYRLVDTAYRRLILYEVLLAEINQLYRKIETDNIKEVYYKLEVTGQ
ncbi:MAG: hypothetical protein PWP12_229 [Bacillota bacterium]|nr:hypothetical protein [Bacillota bacterium]MDK2883223.1 hypothetical protein [Bacillota bacterium]MDK2960045.1 hypothetical protein [Bacillota bacterium]